MNDEKTHADLQAEIPVLERKGFTLAQVLLCAWALVATLVAAFSLTLLIRGPDNVMRMPEEEKHYWYRKDLQPDLAICSADVRHEALQALEKGTADFGTVLDELLEEQTEDTPNGSLISFRIWLSTNPTNWVHDYCSSTNLVLVSFNTFLYGEHFSWFSNGVLYATSDCDLTKCELGNRKRWRSKTFPCIVYHGNTWRRWWKDDRHVWGRQTWDDLPVWDIPPYIWERKRNR